MLNGTTFWAAHLDLGSESVVGWVPALEPPGGGLPCPTDRSLGDLAEEPLLGFGFGLFYVCGKLRIGDHPLAECIDMYLGSGARRAASIADAERVEYRLLTLGRMLGRPSHRCAPTSDP